MFRLPSLTYIVEHARDTSKRFPYPFICSFLGGITAICLIETESDDFWFTKLLMTLGLGIALLFFPETPDLSFDTAEIVKRLRETHVAKDNQVPLGSMTLEASNGVWDGKLYLREINGSLKGDGFQLSYPQGILLLRRAPKP